MKVRMLTLVLDDNTELSVLVPADKLQEGVAVKHIKVTPPIDAPGYTDDLVQLVNDDGNLALKPLGAA